MRVDALVIGAGPAGSVAAARLASAGAVVALFDRSMPTEHKIGESLSPLASQLLRAVGVFVAFDPSKHLISRGVRSAWHASVEERSFLASPYGQGWLLDRPAFDIGLRDFAARSGARVLGGSRIYGVVRHRCHYTLNIASRSGISSIAADWVIDCSGRSAIFSVSQGARRVKNDNLVAFWRLYESPNQPKDEDAHTTIERAPDGWYYTAPIPGGRRVVVFLTDNDLPEGKMALSPSHWQQMLQSTGEICPLLDSHSYVPVSRLHGISASSARLNQPFGFHWIAAGDAAMSFDPLSSRGIGEAILGGSNASGAILEEHAGRVGAFATYAEYISKNYAEYLIELRRRYQTDVPGPSKFWTRRLAVPGLTTPESGWAQGPFSPFEKADITG